MNSELPEFLTTPDYETKSQVARRLNVSRRTIDNLMRQRRLPFIKLTSKIVRFPKCKQQYDIPEEKKTDVNLAVEIINDALTGACEHIIVVSGDSDIQPAVEWVAKNKPEIKITVLVPLLPNEQSARRTDYYFTKGLKVDCKFLPLNGLKENQLNPIIKLGGGKVAVRPHFWQISAQVLIKF